MDLPDNNVPSNTPTDKYAGGIGEITQYKNNTSIYEI